MRNSVARNSVGGLVMVESIIFKRLSTRVGDGGTTLPRPFPLSCTISCALLPLTEWHKCWDVPSMPLSLQTESR